ncbi:hypothetical protein V8C35DRAFT_330131, partial [Trichoderma chlorosporum]
GNISSLFSVQVGTAYLSKVLCSLYEQVDSGFFVLRYVGARLQVYKFKVFALFAFAESCWHRDANRPLTCKMATFQEYQLIAPKIRRYTELKGTLKGLFSNGMGSVLERLIAVPILPKSESLYSAAMASTSSFIEPQDGYRAIEATVGTSSKEPHEIKRLRPDERDQGHAGPPLHQKPVKAKSGSAKDEAKSGPVTFSSLPTELHRQIFDYLEGIDDTLCLGLTSRHFLEIARDGLHKYYASYLGQWAGQSIIFLGEVEQHVEQYVEVDDEEFIYPPELFTKEELALLPTTRHHFTTRPFAEEEKFPNLSKGLFTQCGFWDRYDPAIKAVFRELVAKEATYYPQDEQWILRNLTLKEFVRAEAIALKPEFIRGPFIDGVGFGFILISRILWSTYDCDSMECEIPLHRGIWAGHKFDITTWKKHKAETGDDDEWDDKSEEVTEEIPTICESIYGPEWREIICKQVDDARGAS